MAEAADGSEMKRAIPSFSICAHGSQTIRLMKQRRRAADAVKYFVFNFIHFSSLPRPLTGTTARETFILITVPNERTFRIIVPGLLPLLHLLSFSLRLPFTTAMDIEQIVSVQCVALQDLST